MIKKNKKIAKEILGKIDFFRSRYIIIIIIFPRLTLTFLYILHYLIASYNYYYRLRSH